ncbi:MULTISPECIES: dephospho-CoA kinase [Vagococcus]|uniref:Dephospho-CoA kinase n=1 Tax=Vagococcus fluvialis bH819 TaxID=1255619 RepID=A0A1X6WNN4_9ENTE|nr:MULTISPECIES: dephospho-CoA kinase [Vagococcus]SLM85868.1 Dephospho-CoA kinase [Vagococcus fluvialis bH819]HCM90289.1 dephospho-CoA kinase [Vagococcus sp.]
MSFVLGLTGGIASGKSTVSQYFLEKNIPVIDADIIAKEVVEPRTPGLAKVISHFGSSILTESGELDRKKLGEIIFNNEKERVELNHILHGEIEHRVDQLLSEMKQENKPLIIMDIPLLYEVDYQYKCDEVMTVFVSQNTQVKRLMTREELNEEEALERINTQMPLIDKALLSDVIIDNEGSIQNTRLQVDRWLAIFEQTR